LYRWLDGCGSASGQPGKRYSEQEEGGNTVAQGKPKNWRELCNAALTAKDPDELLKILQELNRTLKREEQVRRDFREAMKTTNPS
jgi:hypothetical protein